MKRILAIVVLTFVSACYVFAQNETTETKNQISIIYGDNRNLYKWVSTWEGLGSGAGESKGTSRNLLYDDGGICIQYLRRLASKIEIGLHFKYEEFGVYLYDRYHSGERQNERNEIYKSFCFTTVAQFNFLKQENFRIYNKSGVGVSPVFITTDYKYKDIKNNLNYHLQYTKNKE